MSLFHSKSITAKQVGHNLVASFATANPPLVWKFDLERNHSFTIALQGEDGDWELGITSPKGEFYPVAHFPSREDAEEALAKVQKVLLKKKRSLFWSIVRWVLGVLVLTLILFLVGSGFIATKIASPMAGLGAASMGMMATPSAQPMAPAGPPTITQGVPVPADDVLQPPK